MCCIGELPTNGINIWYQKFKESFNLALSFKGLSSWSVDAKGRNTVMGSVEQAQFTTARKQNQEGPKARIEPKWSCLHDSSKHTQNCALLIPWVALKTHKRTTKLNIHDLYDLYYSIKLWKLHIFIIKIILYTIKILFIN